MLGVTARRFAFHGSATEYSMRVSKGVTVNLVRVGTGARKLKMEIKNGPRGASSIHRLMTAFVLSASSITTILTLSP